MVQLNSDTLIKYGFTPDGDRMHTKTFNDNTPVEIQLVIWHLNDRYGATVVQSNSPLSGRANVSLGNICDTEEQLKCLIEAISGEPLAQA